MSRVETRIERLEKAENPRNPRKTMTRAAMAEILGREPSPEECNITLEELVAGANEPEEGDAE